MRKKAQERKRGVNSPSSSSSNCSSSSSTVTKASFYDTGGGDEAKAMGSAAAAAAALAGGNKISEEVEEFDMGCYSMDDIWKDIELSEGKNIKQGGNGNFDSPAWDYCWDSIWKMDYEDEESKMMMSNLPNDDQLVSSWAAELSGQPVEINFI